MKKQLLLYRFLTNLSKYDKLHHKVQMILQPYITSVHSARGLWLWSNSLHKFSVNITFSSVGEGFSTATVVWGVC